MRRRRRAACPVAPPSNSSRAGAAGDAEPLLAAVRGLPACEALRTTRRLHMAKRQTKKADTKRKGVVADDARDEANKRRFTSP